MASSPGFNSLSKNEMPSSAGVRRPVVGELAADVDGWPGIAIDPGPRFFVLDIAAGRGWGREGGVRGCEDGLSDDRIL